jgi:hypothetical protein
MGLLPVDSDEVPVSFRDGNVRRLSVLLIGGTFNFGASPIGPSTPSVPGVQPPRLLLMVFSWDIHTLRTRATDIATLTSRFSVHWI